MSDYEEDDAPRLGVSTIVVALTVAVLAVAIGYNALTQTAPQASQADAQGISDSDPITGSTRVTVDVANEDPRGTVHRLEDFRRQWLLMVFHRHLG